MKVTIRKQNNGLYEAMGEWLVHHHHSDPTKLISDVYETFSITPSLRLEKLNQDSFEFPHPENGKYLPLFNHERESIDDAIKREIIKYQN